MMHPFEQLIYDRFAQSIAAWDIERHPDIYAFSCLYDDGWSMDASGQEVAIQSQVQLSFNTLSHYVAQVPHASSAEEAKWNYAFWLQNSTGEVPANFPYGGEPPAADMALRDIWCASLGILPKGTDAGGRPTYDEPTLHDAIRSGCQRVVQALHQNGVILGKLGRSVPVIIHELERTKASATATRTANPPGLSREAEEWQFGRTYAQIASYDELSQEVSSRSPSEQVHFWVEALLAFAWDRPSAIKTRLLEMKRTKYDVQDALALTGPAAMSALLTLIEENAMKEQYHPSTDPLMKGGRWTTESDLVMDALRMVRQIGAVADAEVARLYALLVRLYTDSVGKDWVGTNLSGVASTLYHLRPGRFPAPQTGGGDNKLLNYSAFGLPDARNTH